jgi:hypothetical protein
MYPFPQLCLTSEFEHSLLVAYFASNWPLPGLSSNSNVGPHIGVVVFSQQEPHSCHRPDCLVAICKLSLALANLSNSSADMIAKYLIPAVAVIGSAAGKDFAPAQ